jgi:hypothetical protein
MSLVLQTIFVSLAILDAKLVREVPMLIATLVLKDFSFIELIILIFLVTKFVPKLFTETKNLVDVKFVVKIVKNVRLD